MNIKSIKRLALALILTVGSIFTLPAYAWPDTDEMNMCGAPAKTVRAYAGNYRGWAAHDNYIAHRGKNYYYKTNCPESKARKNYKGKNWAPKAKKRKVYKKRVRVHKKKHTHNPNHMNHADCVRVDAMNNSGAVIRVIRRK